ncbi:HEAT repeat domain-containing protein, partial [Myxococcota bacterium]|nr:HEAT repeat domain-containing protein [Myxococcota bacterium]
KLATLLPHPDWSVRAEAVQALAARRFRRALPDLLRRLEVEDDSYVREALLGAARRLEE